MNVPKVSAVAFDLFGTLVPSFSRSRHGLVLDGVAAATGLPAEVVYECWTTTYAERVLGAVGGFADQLERLAEDCDLRLTESVRADCRQLHGKFVAESLTATDATLAALVELRDLDMSLVLVSNANPDVADVWPSSNLAPLFDAAVSAARSVWRSPTGGSTNTQSE